LASTPPCCPAAPATPEAATVETFPTPLILFDGVCNLCSWSVQFLAPRDRHRALWFAAVQSATGQAALKAHGLPVTDYESFVLVENGQAYFKSDAFFRTLRYMTWPWPLLRVGRFVQRPLADWLYDRVARNRYAVFGRKATCMPPRADLAARFLP
jgi:predicted DCC family thiol-disulfide oxidoreductase YuxK